MKLSYARNAKYRIHSKELANCSTVKVQRLQIKGYDIREGKTNISCSPS